MTQPAFEQRLAALDLTSVMRRVATEEGMDAVELAKAEKMYRQFLQLIHTHGQSKTLVPPALADLVWHTHIIDTRKYLADCDMLFGEVLHHDPDFYYEDDTHHASSKEETEELFCQEFATDLASLVAYSDRKNLSVCGGGGA